MGFKNRADAKSYNTAYMRQWRKKNHSRWLKGCRDRYAADPNGAEKKRIREQRRRARVRHKHIGRKKRCDICKRIRILVIDHDHLFAKRYCNHHPKQVHCTRCRRGALCHGCNMALGQFQDDLKRPAQYLKYWRKRK